MNAAASIRRAVLSGLALVLLAALWLVGFTVSIGGFPEDRPPGFWREFVVLSVVLATPWMVTIWLLRWAWRAEGTTASATMDAPARLLAVAIATLPEARRDWGAAMLTELGQVRARSARWRFAVGCARVAIFPPRSNRGPVIATMALGAGAVILTGLTVGEALPPMRVFAVTFVGLIGAAAVVTVARVRPLFRRTSGPLVVAIGITGVASCIAATVYLVDQHPTAALHLHPAAAIFLATILAGALWLIVAPPRALTGDRLASYLAVGVAVVLGLGLLLASRSDLKVNGGDGDGIFGFVHFMPVPAIFVTALLVGAVRRSVRAGVQATVWTALLAALAFFAIAVSESVLWYQDDESLILAGDAVKPEFIGENIRNFTWFLILFPFFWAPFGVIGAAVGSVGRASLSRAVAATTGRSGSGPN
jgi:hypothetical protein